MFYLTFYQPDLTSMPAQHRSRVLHFIIEIMFISPSSRQHIDNKWYVSCDVRQPKRYCNQWLRLVVAACCSSNGCICNMFVAKHPDDTSRHNPNHIYIYIYISIYKRNIKCTIYCNSHFIMHLDSKSESMIKCNLQYMVHLLCVASDCGSSLFAARCTSAFVFLCCCDHAASSAHQQAEDHLLEGANSKLSRTFSTIPVSFYIEGE